VFSHKNKKIEELRSRLASLLSEISLYLAKINEFEAINFPLNRLKHEKNIKW
jgi:hypothetical protein